MVSLLVFDSIFFTLFTLLIGISGIFIMQKIPDFMANIWRMKSSNQMVLCIFYVVTYMRHTSNLELAIEFASEHLAPPLSLDLRKVIWDVESGRFEALRILWRVILLDGGNSIQSLLSPSILLRVHCTKPRMTADWACLIRRLM